MEVHADRIVEEFLRTGRGEAAVALLVLVRDVGLDLFGADDRHVELLEDGKVFVGGRLVLHRRRHDLVEFVVRDVAAVLLGALLHFLDDRIALFGTEHAVAGESRHVGRIELVAVAGRRHRKRVVHHDLFELRGIGHVGGVGRRTLLVAQRLVGNLLDVELAGFDLRGLGFGFVLWRRDLKAGNLLLKAVVKVVRLGRDIFFYIRVIDGRAPLALLLFAVLLVAPGRRGDLLFRNLLSGCARFRVFLCCHKYPDSSRLQYYYMPKSQEDIITFFRILCKDLIGVDFREHF